MKADWFSRTIPARLSEQRTRGKKGRLTVSKVVGEMLLACVVDKLGIDSGKVPVDPCPTHQLDSHTFVTHIWTTTMNNMSLFPQLAQREKL